MTDAEHDAHPFLSIFGALLRLAAFLVIWAVLLSVGLAVLVVVAYAYGFGGVCTALAVPGGLWLWWDKQRGVS